MNRLASSIADPARALGGPGSRPGHRRAVGHERGASLAQRLAGGLLALLLPMLLHAQVPIAELAGGSYMGRPGGLYPGGSNTPPAAHLQLALQQADAIQPLDAQGQPHAEGWIGFVAIGMSNTSQEFKVLDWLLAAAPDVNPALRVVNGAQGSVPAEHMANPAHGYWDLLEQRVRAAGLEPAQVQACWLKQALGSVSDFGFPAHVDLLEQHLAAIVRNARVRFPNLRLCYLANRIYGGYTSRPERGEPLSYESGFAVQGLIARQIAGDALLNPDPLAGPVQAPVLIWGSEQWANGSTPRLDGLAWRLEDYEDDRIHPSLSGELKAGQRWMAALRSDPAAARWLFRPMPGQRRLALPPSADATVSAGQPAANFGQMEDLRFGWPSPGVEAMAYLRFEAGALLPGDLIGARLYLHVLNASDPQVWPVSPQHWEESTLSWNQRPPLGAPDLHAGHAWNGDGSASLDLGAEPGISADGRLNIALRRPPGQPVQRAASRETTLPPLLVLRLRDERVFADGFDGPPLALPRLSLAP